MQGAEPSGSSHVATTLLEPSDDAATGDGFIHAAEHGAGHTAKHGAGHAAEHRHWGTDAN